jgi:hypothetical protein
MIGIRYLPSSLAAIGLLCGVAQSANADGEEAARLIQSTTEARTYVHFKLNNDTIRKVLPAGWASAPGTGALQDANLILLLVEGLAADSADGKAILNQGKFVLWAVPAKNERTGAAGIMIVGGLTSQPQASPGAYGVYAPARITMTKSSRSQGAGATVVEENWDASNDAGERLRFSVSYERGVGVRAHVEPRAHAAIKPDFYRIYKADQVTDIVHSVVAGGRRAAKVEFVSAGPSLARIFDGKEELIAVTSIPAYYRQILLPNW